MNIWWTIHLRREAASVPLARRILLGTMESVGVDPQVSHDIGIALTEACANVVEHAGAGAPDEYQVTVTIDGERCGVEVVDFGLGFTAGDPADPHSGAAEADAQARDDAAEPGADQDWFLSDAAALFCDASSFAEMPWDAPVERGRAAEALGALPEDPTAESGRGLFLIQALVDHVQFRNHPCRGAVVSFDKTLRWRSDRPTAELLRAS